MSPSISGTAHVLFAEGSHFIIRNVNCLALPFYLVTKSLIHAYTQFGVGRFWWFNYVLVSLYTVVVWAGFSTMLDIYLPAGTNNGGSNSGIQHTLRFTQW